jgi:ABC-type transporter Mla subunit MlaD
MRFVLVALLACVLSAGGERDRVAHVVLPAVRDVRDGTPVRYRGIVVGTVKAVRIVDSGVRHVHDR